MPTSPGSRTLKVTISVDSDKAIEEIGKIQTALAGMTGGKAGGAAGGAAAGGAAGGAAAKTAKAVGDAAETSKKKVESLDKALEKLIKKGGQRGAVAQELLKLNQDAKQPLGKKATGIIGAAQADTARSENVARKAGLRETGAPSLIAEQRKALGNLGVDVEKYAKSVERGVRVIGASGSAVAKKAFQDAADNARATAKNVLTQFDRLEQKKAEVAKRRAGDMSITTTKADVVKQEAALAQAQREHAAAEGELARTGREYTASASKMVSDNSALKASLEAINNETRLTKQNYARLGEGIKEMSARVTRDIAASGGKADAVLRSQFNLLKIQANNALNEVKRTWDNLQTALAKKAENKGSQAEVDRAQAEHNVATDAYNATMGRLQDTGERLVATTTRTERATRGATDATASATATTRTATATTSDYSTSMDKARRAAYAWSIAGYQMQATLGVVTQQLQSSVASFAEFDFTVRRAAGALGVFDQTGSAFDKLGQAIEQTAIQAKLFSPKEIAQGYYYWGSTTGQVVKSQQDLLNIQKQVLPIMQMAAITQTDLQTSLKGVYSVMQQYNMPMEAAQGVTEKLFMVTQKTAAELPDLLESFKMVGPIANEMGISFDDVIGMLGGLANAGVKSGMAGRALRQTFVKLTDPTVRASKALDAATRKTYGLGKSFSDLIFPDGKFVGMQKYLNIMSDLTKDLTQEERGRLLGIITTQNELPALTKLINANTVAMKSNKAGVVDQAKAMYGSADAAAMFAGAVNNQMQSAEAVFSELGAVFSSTAIELGKNIWSMIRPFMQAAIEIGKFILAAIQTNPIFASLAAGGLLVAGVLIALVSSALIASGSIMLLKAVIEFQLIPSLAAGATASGTFGAAIVGMTTAMIGLMRAVVAFLFTNPIGWLVLIIGALIIAKGKVGEFGDSLMKVVGFFGFLISNIGDALAGPFKSLIYVFENIPGLIANIVGGIGSLVGGFLDTVSKIDFVREAIEALKKAIPKSAPTPGNDAETKFNIPKGYSKAALQSPALYQVGPAVYQQQQEIFRKLAEKEAELRSQTFKHAMDERADGMATALADQLAAAVKLAQDRASQAIDLTKMLSRVFRKGKADDAKAAIERADGYLQALVARFDESSGPAMEAVASGITNLLNSDSSFASKIGTALSGAVEKGFLAGDLTAVEDGVQRFLRNVTDRINSDKESLRISGGNAFSEFLDGFSGYDFSANPDAKVQLQKAMILLTTPGAQAAGLAAGIEFLKQMGFAVNAADAWSEVGRKGEERILKPFDLSKLIPKPEDPKGTGGGSKQQTALEKALDVARQAAELAESLQKVAGKDLKAMVKSSMGKIAEAVVLADKITYDVTKSFSKAKLKAVAEFSENSSKVMALISAAADAFEKMTRFKRIPVKAFNDLKVNVIDAVRAMVQAAKPFTDVKMLATAIVFSENVQKVMTAIGTALDVFAKMPETFTRTPQKIWNDIALDIGAAVTGLGNAAKKVKDEVLWSARNFAEASSEAISVISSAIDLFVKVGDLGTYTRQPATLWTALTADIAAAVDALGKAAAKVKGPVIDAAKDFSDAAGNAIEVVGNAVDMFDKLPALADLPDGTIFLPISERIGMMATSLGTAAGEVDANLLGAAKKFAEKVGPVVGVIGDAVEALNGVAAFVTPDSSQIVNVVVSIRNVMNAMAAEIDPKKFNAKLLTLISNFSKSAIDALNAVKTANDVFAPTVEDLVDMGTKMVHMPPQIGTSVKWIVDVMEAIKTEAVKYPKDVTEAVTRVSQAAQAVIETVKSLLDTFAAQDLSQAGMHEWVTNIRKSIEIALQTIKTSLEPFVTGFTVTGGNIVTNIVTGINEKLPSLRKAVDELKALLKEAMDTQAAIATATAMAGAAGGVAGGSGLAQLIQTAKDNIKRLEKIPAAKRTTAQKSELANWKDILKEYELRWAAGERANGGPVSAGQTYLVGERGPELFRPAQNGNIIGSVTSASSEITVTHIVKGDVSSMTATQIAAMLNSSMGSLATAISTSSKR